VGLAGVTGLAGSLADAGLLLCCCRMHVFSLGNIIVSVIARMDAQFGIRSGYH